VAGVGGGLGFALCMHDHPGLPANSTSSMHVWLARAPLAIDRATE
jgi:hypothetical protein